MLITLPFLLFSLLLAAVAGDFARRQRRSAGSTTEPAATDPDSPMVALARLGRAGKPLAAPSRLAFKVLPANEPGTALEILSLTGEHVRRVPISHIAMARGWSGGRLVLASGRARDDFGPPWPLGPNLAGWELHIGTLTGESIRCYGTPGATLDSELSALQDQLGRGRLLRAS